MIAAIAAHFDVTRRRRELSARPGLRWTDISACQACPVPFESSLASFEVTGTGKLSPPGRDRNWQG